MNAGLLEEIDMHRSVQASIKQLLLEAHDLSGNSLDRNLAELQAHRVRLIGELTAAYQAAATATQRLAALELGKQALQEQNEQLRELVSKLRRGSTPTGLVEFGELDR